MNNLRYYVDKHPYYMNETNYLADGSINHGQMLFDTVEDFLAEWGDSDLDYNAVFRWDIKEKRDEDDKPLGTYSMQIAMILQRKGHLIINIIGEVTEESLEPIVTWLQGRYGYIKRIWEPIS